MGIVLVFVPNYESKWYIFGKVPCIPASSPDEVRIYFKPWYKQYVSLTGAVINICSQSQVYANLQQRGMMTTA